MLDIVLIVEDSLKRFPMQNNRREFNVEICLLSLFTRQTHKRTSYFVSHYCLEPGIDIHSSVVYISFCRRSLKSNCPSSHSYTSGIIGFITVRIVFSLNDRSPGTSGNEVLLFEVMREMFEATYLHVRNVRKRKKMK